MINYSSSFRRFLNKSDSRIAKILAKIDRDYDYYTSKYRQVITTELIDYITFRNDGTISFLPAGKEHKEEDGRWARDGRQNGRPGKVIRKLFTDKVAALIPPKEFEVFSNQYKAEYNSDGYEFSLLPNKKIPAVYDMNRAPGGRLGDSCMNHDVDYLDIYKNCKQLSILILKNKEDLLCGRALVWKIDDEFTLLDRIYTSQDFFDEMFISYAIKEKWHYKVRYMSCDDTEDFITPDGKKISKRLTVKTPTDFDKYPYIDTFHSGGEGSLNNYGDGEYSYNNTDGTRDAHDSDYDEDDHDGQSYDDITDRWIDENYAVQIERGQRRGNTTHRDNTVQVGNYTYWERDDSIIQIDDEWHLKSECVWSEKDQEDYLKNDCVYSDAENSWILENEATEIDGKWYHDDDVVWSKRDREPYLEEDCVQMENDDWILRDEAVEIDGAWVHENDVTEDKDDEQEEAFVDADDRVTVTNDPNQIALF